MDEPSTTTFHTGGTFAVSRVGAALMLATHTALGWGVPGQRRRNCISEQLGSILKRLEALVEGPAGLHQQSQCRDKPAHYHFFKDSLRL